MDRERIASLRLLEKHLRASGQMAGAVIGELLDVLEAAQAHIARLEAGRPDLADLIRKRYPRLLAPGNPLYDGALARVMEAQAAAQVGGASVSEEELVALRCLDDAVTINGDGISVEALGVNWEVARSAKRRLANIRAAKGGAT